jgi:hypothetical protein
VSNNRAPEFHYSAGSRSFRARRSRFHRLAGNATARLAPGAGLIAALLLSLGLWGAIWAAASSVTSAWHS